MLISPERGRKRRGSGTVFAQCPDQFVQFAPPLCTPGTVSVTPIGETRAERCQPRRAGAGRDDARCPRSEEHTSELQSLMRISYAVFCLKKKSDSSSRNADHPDDITATHHTHINSATPPTLCI